MIMTLSYKGSNGVNQEGSLHLADGSYLGSKRKGVFPLFLADHKATVGIALNDAPQGIEFGVLA